ncbi:MAG TPA: hypothetical protein VMI06_04870 [Terriglobia bacterium]|nr:hypothetical protein [Terriglobia bacterium]
MTAVAAPGDDALSRPGANDWTRLAERLLLSNIIEPIVEERKSGTKDNREMKGIEFFKIRNAH